ncbi:prolyl 4-hydroxylase subunit alpha-2-like [Drosophila rhopaloa]|uniref:Prolyl 4-hydroxylase N-terminal domain-containing protein n=1 Tax=Drosophila rhopaloa TaxID=1041015 RepID=A0ABM5J6F0_DRORH|nr:prolyl 4-hydroxylase subunit alpha-2-like [Drosophila rhopaloa]
MNSEHYQMNNNYETYLGNPVNSFRLLHRLHTDWRKWHHYSLNNNKDELEHIDKSHKMRTMLPTSLDLERACRGIEDLISFYDLKPDDLAEGYLAGFLMPETALSARDCYALGEFCINNRREDRAEAWFNISLNQFTDQKLLHGVNHFSRYSVQKSWAVLLMKNQETPDAIYDFGEPPKDHLSQWIYEEVVTKRNCRATFRQPSRLHCRYNSSTTPFTLIAPLKMEELSFDPYMVVYHDVIYESEINWLLNTSEFSLSLVDNAAMSEFRASKDSTIRLPQGIVVETLGQRVTDMTGLSMENSDEFSLINYGLGGHYVLHTDYHNYMNQTRWEKGDRMATVLFYVSQQR